MTTMTAIRLEPNDLAVEHLPLVDRIVGQLAARFPAHVDREELRSAGAAGLVDAAHRYDPDSGVPFARYAVIRIRGAIIDATRSRDWATRRLRRDLRRIGETSEYLEERLHRPPDDVEIAAHLGIDVEVVRERRASALASKLLALDRQNDAGTGPLSDRVVEDDHTWVPEAALEGTELVGTLWTAIEHLPELPKQVLVEHQFHGRKLCDIADVLGVTEARASQLRLEAIHALRAYFATTYDDVPAVPKDAPGKRRRADYVEHVTSTTTWRSRLEATPSATDVDLPATRFALA
jgi:RNA polymerase sigma factor FliA